MITDDCLFTLLVGFDEKLAFFHESNYTNFEIKRCLTAEEDAELFSFKKEYAFYDRGLLYLY